MYVDKISVAVDPKNYYFWTITAIAVSLENVINWLTTVTVELRSGIHAAKDHLSSRQNFQLKLYAAIEALINQLLFACYQCTFCSY